MWELCGRNFPSSIEKANANRLYSRNNVRFRVAVSSSCRSAGGATAVQQHANEIDMPNGTGCCSAAD